MGKSASNSPSIWVSVDVEADGPCPGLYSMTELGAVIINLDNTIGSTFYTSLRPISQDWDPEALAVTGYTREETLAFESPELAMVRFKEWLGLEAGNKIKCLTDTSGFDWQFINYYFHMFLRDNPFGRSCTGLSSLYKGCVHDMRKSFKHLRKTKHTHNPVDDAMGNAEAFIAMKKLYSL